VKLPFARKAPQGGDPALLRRTVRAMREDRGRFAALRDTRVLLYWPHGFGDWTHLGTVAPLLEPSNAYAVCRFGDDYTSVMEGNRFLTPLLGGGLSPSDRGASGPPHLGLRLERCNGVTAEIAVPPGLAEPIARFAPAAVLWTDYPETEGRTPFPFHTKARNLARLLVDRKRLDAFDLSAPLPSSIDFDPPAQAQQAVDERLMQLAPPGTRLCVVSRTGFTAARKNWGDGSEASAFAAALRAGDRRWRFISMDDETLGEGSAGFRALFADAGEPFARTFKALAARTDLFVGVPAGPLHATMARGGVPVVGIWLAHHPDWYDEPNPQALHLVGRFVRDRGFQLRPASVTKPPALLHRIVYLDTTGVSAADATAAALEVSG
jgi:hypothetical protein